MFRTHVVIRNAVVTTALATGLVTAGLSSAAAHAAAPRFCLSARDVTTRLPSSLSDLRIATAKRLAHELDGLVNVAPNSSMQSLRNLSKWLSRYATTKGGNARTVLAGRMNARFAVETSSFVRVVSSFCPDTVPTSPKLPNVDTAKLTACLQDQDTIKQAEDVYSTLNGTYASMTELVSAQFLRQVSSYYSDVRVDDPPGGYTLVAVPSGPCANVPVAG
jgi:hypothetical protein